ncbi:MAG: tetratricopeptide repeat protein, partial [Anaerolineae bacterium]|nr:tetratricopeptide repeat protein [Anaerolineae bacterium]
MTRQRLLNRLYDMVDYKLALVSAPAGYGKSTLLVDFATELEHPVCWYALDASDRDPHVFLERLVMSLQRRFPDFGEATLRALAASQDLSGGAPGVVRILVNEIVTRIPRWFVLVLDDYHALGRALDVDAILSNFVVYQRDQWLTIISSRTVPNLPLIIPLVARGGVGGIGQDEMRFTPEEIQALFAHNYGTELSVGEAAELAEQSEGWITGLLLTAYSHWQGVLQSWMRARSSNQPVYDYLAQEVFDRQAPSMQEFLSVSSTLGEMNITLCREILEVADAQDFLDAIEVHNLFVTRFEGDWYRYHHLFSEFLQSHLRRQDPDRWELLHRRASAWFERLDRYGEAIHHYLAIDALEEAARLMVTTTRALYVSGQFTTLMTWRDRLPDEILLRVPRLALYQSRAAYKLGLREAGLLLTGLAEKGYQEVGDQEGVAYAELHLAEVRLAEGNALAALELGSGALRAVETSQVSVELESHRILGRAYVSLGQLDRGHEHLNLALDVSEAAGDDYSRALVRTGLAECLGLKGAVSEAVLLHREAVEIWRRIGSDAGLADELNDLGFHLCILGEYDEALRCFQEVLSVSRETGLRRTEAFSLVNFSEMSRDLGLLDQAADYGELGLELASEIGERYLIGYGLENKGLVLRAQDDRPAALELLEAALAEAKVQGSDSQIGRYRASFGITRAEMGMAESGSAELDAAIESLTQLGVSTELRRAMLFKAEALFLGGQKEAAIALVGELLDAELSPADRHSLVTEGQWAAPLLQAARKAFSESDPARDAGLKTVQSAIRALNKTAQRLFPQVASKSAVPASQIKIFGFGSGRVEVGGEAIPGTAWGSVSARQLLFYMLIHKKRTREEIAAAFWPDLTAQKAKATFHTTKFRLSRALGQDVIDFDGRVYTLHPDLAVWFDVDQFEQNLSTWRETQDVDVLAEAVDLYAGDLLPECYLDWCEAEREALRVSCLEASETLAERLLARRQYRRAVRALRQALALEPARETFHQQLMRAYALS